MTQPQTDRWFTLAELAALGLPGIPDTRRGLAAQAEREEWGHEAAEGRLWRRRQGRGGGIEYWIGVLPSFTQAKLLAREAAATPAPWPDTAQHIMLRTAAWLTLSPPMTRPQTRRLVMPLGSSER